MKSNPVLLTNDLAIGYREKHKAANVLVDDINLAIYPGDFVCLIGPNGCGKSTLLRTLAGIQKPLSGNIKIDGKELAECGRDELSKKTSIVLTENFGVVNTSVQSIVSLGRSPYNNWLGTMSIEDLAVINNVLEATGLTQFKEKNLQELSDGILQKVMIARALAQDTPLILLDEPTAFLDAPSKLEIIHMLRALARQFNKSIILSSHDLDLVLQSADKVVLVTKNRKIEIDTPEDLVLNGHFEAAFNKEDVKFSLRQGMFKLDASEKINLQVNGEKPETFWTERALARIGISVNPEKEHDGTINIIIRDKRTEWQLNYKSGTEIFYSISELLKRLKAVLTED
jgi:iron complex transport system ATP-binding protein